MTAAAYCDFLNNKAVTDTEHFYDDAMGSEPDAACILRFGQPGDFSYAVIAGRENVPVSYVNALQQKAFCEWSGAQIKGDQNNDLSLRSNELFFNVIENSANTSLSTSGNGSSDGSSWSLEDAGLLIAGVATVAFFAPTLRENFVPDDWQKPKAPYEESDFIDYDNSAREKYVDSFSGMVSRGIGGILSSSDGARMEDTILPGDELVASSKEQKERLKEVTTLKELLKVRLAQSEREEAQQTVGFYDQAHRLNVGMQQQRAVQDGKVAATAPSLGVKFSFVRRSAAPAAIDADSELPPEEQLRKLALEYVKHNQETVLQNIVPRIKKWASDLSASFPSDTDTSGERRRLVDSGRTSHAYSAIPTAAPAEMPDIDSWGEWKTLKVLGEKLEANKPLSEHEKETLARTIGTVNIRLYPLLQRVLDEERGASAEEIAKNYADSSKWVTDKINNREAAQACWNTYQRSIDLEKRLTFVKDQATKDAIDRQLWNILFEEEKGKETTVRVLKKVFENYVRGLEARQRVYELGGGSDQKVVTLRDAYRKLQGDLAADNNRLGLTPMDRLRYAFDQQRPISFNDPYNVAPNLTRVVGGVFVSGLILPMFLHHTAGNVIWCAGSWGTLLYRILLVGGAFA